MSIEFIDPVGESQVQAKDYGLSADLHGEITVGLVINDIVGCADFMEQVGKALKNSRPGIRLQSYKTGRITFADAGLMDRVARECDVAVCAIGHCGSCTAGTVKDGIALVERGCPAVSLVTELFWDQGEALARSLGWPGAPRVKLPYPIWGTGVDTMTNAAVAAVDAILPLLEDPGERRT